MKEQNSQAVRNQDLIAEIGTEVGQESAPLLEFITNNGGKIAAFVLLLVLVTALSALWQWHTKKERSSFLNEMSAVTLQRTGQDKVKTLEALGKKAPDSLKAISWLTVGDAANENQDFDLASEAYAKAAKADADGVTGTMAQLAHIASLLKNDKNQEALELLHILSRRLGDEAPLVFKNLYADAASRSGDYLLASQLLEDMAKELSGDDAAFIKKRALALQLKAADKASGNSSQESSPSN
ncbi:MAG: hypothetical protein K5657_00855 [Desulfovibrio sp.]|nr:hypothetical protein [Desulfovibrio sp.]